MRKITLAALTLGAAIALGPGIANAAHGGFPAGARLYAFGGPPVPHSPGKIETANTRPILAGPLDFLNAVVGEPNRPLEYPFLNPRRCASQSAANRSCATAPSPIAGDGAASPNSVVQ